MSTIVTRDLTARLCRLGLKLLKVGIELCNLRVLTGPGSVHASGGSTDLTAANHDTNTGKAPQQVVATSNPVRQDHATFERFTERTMISGPCANLVARLVAAFIGSAEDPAERSSKSKTRGSTSSQSPFPRAVYGSSPRW